MNLKEMMSLSSLSGNTKIGLSEERVRAIIPVARQYIAFWREYPDLFVDFLQTGGKEGVETTFKFYFYQRCFLRAAMRHRKVFACFPRGYSKSFLSVLTQMIRCILYPGAKLYSAAGGKSQSAGILSEKIEEICVMIPAFDREIDRRRGKTVIRNDYCKYVFKNGSYIDNMTAGEKSRGKRRQGGIFEECVSIDKDILQQVLIPIANISRRCMDGSKHSEEPLNQSELYITTAGCKADYAYQKLIQLLVEMIVNPSEAFIMGGTYRIPVLAGLYDKNLIDSLKRDDTFNEATFGREYESIWTGTAEDAFFDGENFDRNRILQKPEYEASGRSSAQAYYIISVDVGRKGCQSVAIVFKVTPQPQGPAIKSVVNLYAWEDEHFENQAIRLKELYYKYNARRLVIDGNGLGIGLIDYMIKPQIIPSSGEVYPDFGIYNDDEGYYKKYRSENCEDNAIYIVKAQAPLNTEAYSATQTALTSGKLKFLIDERTAKDKLMNTSAGKAMSPEKRREYLIPYVLTGLLRDEMLNLREENEGVNIILKPASKKIKKDKFSALAYGLYYIKQEEDSKRKKRNRNFSEWRFYTSR